LGGVNNLSLRLNIQLSKQALDGNLRIGPTDGDLMIRPPQCHTPEELFLSGC
jgi:hypothetical protein